MALAGTGPAHSRIYLIINLNHHFGRSSPCIGTSHHRYLAVQLPRGTVGAAYSMPVPPCEHSLSKQNSSVERHWKVLGSI